MNSSLSFAKIWFGLSLLALAFVYGFASHAWGLFPKTYVEQAWRQYQEVSGGNSNNLPFLSERVYDQEGVVTLDEQEMEPGMTLITSAWKESDGGWGVGMKLIDARGKVVHRWDFDRTSIFTSSSRRKNPEKTDIHGSYLLPGGDVLANIEYVGLIRANSCSSVEWKIREGNHHSIHVSEDGDFWTPAVDERRRETEKYPQGFTGINKKVWLGRVINISGEGKIVDEFNMMDVIYENSLQRYIPKTLGTHRPDKNEPIADIAHINDVEELSPKMSEEYPIFEPGDLLVSSRNLQMVFVLDGETKRVKWYEHDEVIYQHDPDFIGNGWVGVFDNNTDFTNRGEMLGGSRIVAFQPHTDSMKTLFQGEAKSPFYTPVQGKWQMLDNGNMLLTEAVTGRVLEVTKNGTVVWEWIHKSHGSRVPYVTKATRHDLTREDVASWPCSSVDSISTSAQ